MREWFSTAKLVGLDGLPSSRRGILEKAKRENWQSRKRQGRGGGLEYHVSSLPQVTQNWLDATKITKSTKIPYIERARAKIRIAEYWRRFLLKNQFCEAYNSGELKVPEWVAEEIPSISESDLDDFTYLAMVLSQPD
ncbi:MAG: hypothetical protein CVV41_06865 [Candidatus Riflebacteria bacterium HGW-Riflebacteria-1]|jgi:hypothetical protein|nr:MAG: hypothetical protein CVV41_06865 [Candidatus Riflebacteria bacterium HGW-Riflebacteria-1]